MKGLKLTVIAFFLAVFGVVACLPADRPKSDCGPGCGSPAMDQKLPSRQARFRHNGVIDPEDNAGKHAGALNALRRRAKRSPDRF